MRRWRGCQLPQPQNSKSKTSLQNGKPAPRIHPQETRPLLAEMSARPRSSAATFSVAEARIPPRCESHPGAHRRRTHEEELSCTDGGYHSAARQDGARGVTPRETGHAESGGSRMLSPRGDTPRDTSHAERGGSRMPSPPRGLAGHFTPRSYLPITPR